jgi:WD repeat-containing protein 48
MAAVLPNGDYTAPSTKRVSYILPPIRHAPRLFHLPTLKDNVGNARGRSGPLLLSPGFEIPLSSSGLNQSRNAFGEGSSAYGIHPRHCLPVSSLALDTSTILGGSKDGKPSGILYTGGRDGMIGAWELGLRMKKRRNPKRSFSVEENEGDEEEAAGLLDEQTTEREMHKSNAKHDYSEWEIDDESDSIAPTPAAKFRQCIGSHTDWINDIVLCNQNQTGECWRRRKRLLEMSCNIKC